MAKTYLPNPTTDTEVTIDAAGKVLGRLATEIATILRGKHKATFAPNKVTGERVVVTNAAKVAVTGRKLEQKVYYRHTGYPGGLRERTLAEVMAKDPTEVIRHAVAGMLPHNRLHKELMKRLTIYALGSPSPKAKD